MSDFTDSSRIPRRDPAPPPEPGVAAPPQDDALYVAETATIQPDHDHAAAGRAGQREPSPHLGPASTPRRRPRRLRRRLLVGSLLALSLLVVAAGGYVWWLASFTGKVERVPGVFASIPQQQRPPGPAAGEPGYGALTVLLAGTDRRSDVPTTGADAEADQFVPGEQRTDTIMLLHLTSDRKNAYVISIPRDLWVRIPGRGSDKVNAAYSIGGPSLYVQTIEQLTGIRIDHLAVVDWSGFKALTDAVGGITINVPRTVYDQARGKIWTAGDHRLDGDEALLYVRQRYGLPGGDLDRVKRQQNFLRSLTKEALSQGTLTNPWRLGRLVDAVTKAVSVDDTLDDRELRGLVFSLRNLRQDDLTFLTVPTRGLGRVGAASVVFLDEERAEALWTAVRSDDVPTYLAKYGKADDQLGDRPR